MDKQDLKPGVYILTTYNSEVYKIVWVSDTNILLLSNEQSSEYDRSSMNHCMENPCDDCNIPLNIRERHDDYNFSRNLRLTCRKISAVLDDGIAIIPKLKGMFAVGE